MTNPAVRSHPQKNIHIHSLTHSPHPDTNFTGPFLMMFHQFSTAPHFFQALVHRYNIQPPPTLTSDDHKLWVDKKQTPIRLRVANILRSWLEHHWIDELDDIVLDKIQDFAKEVMLASQPVLAGRIMECVHRKVNTSPHWFTQTP